VADLIIDSLAGDVEIVDCHGNASVAGAGELRVTKVHGDLRVAQATAVNAKEVRGDTHINDTGGSVSVNTKGDAHVHRAGGSVSINCNGDAHLAEMTSEEIQINAKGDIHLTQCQANITINTAGDARLSEIVSQRVRAVAKGDVYVHFAEAVGGQAKIVTNGGLLVRNGEKTLRKNKGVYSFRFGEGDAVLALVSKGDTLLEGMDVTEDSLRGVNEEMDSLGVEMVEMGAELGEMGAELGREFGTMGRDIARQVQDKVQRKLKARIKKMGKRTAKVEWGDGKSWSFNFGDEPKSPTLPKAPSQDAPFDAVEEVGATEPVSEEERSLVLRMLEEGKISAAEAATLLEALGDGE
jgi:hypothetical protein